MPRSKMISLIALHLALYKQKYINYVFDCVKKEKIIYIHI